MARCSPRKVEQKGDAEHRLLAPLIEEVRLIAGKSVSQGRIVEVGGGVGLG
jgi:hypothetical protein